MNKNLRVINVDEGKNGQTKMIELFTSPTPNGWKISIMLEECGLPYEVHPVDLGRGEQLEASFLEISPNGRIPAIRHVLLAGRRSTATGTLRSSSPRSTKEPMNPEAPVSSVRATNQNDRAPKNRSTPARPRRIRSEAGARTLPSPYPNRCRCTVFATAIRRK